MAGADVAERRGELGEERWLEVGQGEEPSYEGTLAQLGVGCLLVNVDKRAQLLHVELNEAVERDGADEYAGIDAVGHRREQESGVERAGCLAPGVADKDMVEERADVVQMTGIEVGFFLKLCLIGLETEHGHIGNEIVEGALDIVGCELLLA